MNFRLSQSFNIKNVGTKISLRINDKLKIHVRKLTFLPKTRENLSK